MAKSDFQVVGLTKIHSHWGENPSEFLVELHCEVSRETDMGGEAFRVTVASPAQLTKEIGQDELKLGRGYLFMIDYDEPRLLAFLQGFLNRSGAKTWQDLDVYVDRYFQWI